MCGISGIISLNGVQADPQSLQRMNNILRHRGPDGDGFLFQENAEFITAWGVDTPDSIRQSSAPFSPRSDINSLSGKYTFGFAHRRLAIIDLSENGHQPFCNQQQEIWITYNGEIYNYLELKERLKAKGHVFSTRTDTEVILAAYQEWGTACVNEFNGMWAFVIYDHRKKLFFGSRDRFGVKPFYYYSDKNQFIFASEQKALLTHPAVKTGINPVALADYFMAGETEYQEEGMFQNIFELFPAHSFSIDARTGQFSKWSYYSLKPNEAFSDFNEPEFKKYRDQTEVLLKEAVRLRMRSDVPIGSCLSGGIDSSALVGIMHDLLGKKGQLNTFTAAFPKAVIDEGKWAQLVVDQTQAIAHTCEPQRKDLQKDLEDLIWCQDVPIWSTSTYAQYSVMKLAKASGIKVILDGQGGDELFAGYDPYHALHVSDQFHAFKFGQALQSAKAFGSFPGNLKALGKEYFKLKTMHRLGAGIQTAILTSYFKDIAYLQRDLVQQYRENLKTQHNEAPHSLNGMLLKEFVNTRLKTYLKCEDRCSMRHSVEARTPFADDHQLIEYAFGIPGNFKIQKGISKYLLRESVRKYIPEPIYNRTDKMGYVTPNNRWITEMREDLKPYFTDVLKPYLQTDKLLKDYDTFFNVDGQVENGRIFKFMVFAVWMKVFNLK
jgi:asparagine synthase (glutamine-hydrolysing)